MLLYHPTYSLEIISKKAEIKLKNKVGRIRIIAPVLQIDKKKSNQPQFHFHVVSFLPRNNSGVM